MRRKVGIAVTVIVLAAAVVVAGRSGIFKEKSIVATEASAIINPLELTIKFDKNTPAQPQADPF
jgi:hypothetical protein